MDKKIEKLLNDQIAIEGNSSQIYLAMASWVEKKGLEGVAGFLYTHSDEERLHMLKLIHFVNDRGGIAVIPSMDKPKSKYNSILNLFKELYQHELMVTSKINNIVKACLQLGDFTTQSFIQWYVNEQIEEEALAQIILDKLNLIGSDKSGLYMFDRDIQNISVNNTQTQ